VGLGGKYIRRSDNYPFARYRDQAIDPSSNANDINCGYGFTKWFNDANQFPKAFNQYHPRTREAKAKVS
jgi:hypothetical protein